jgi:hypothetical protein
LGPIESGTSLNNTALTLEARTILSAFFVKKHTGSPHNVPDSLLSKNGEERVSRNGISVDDWKSSRELGIEIKINLTLTPTLQ